MKKRLLSLFLVLAMLCAMSVSASAVTLNGKTDGGYNDLGVKASLTMSNLDAYATTILTPQIISIVYTTVTFAYTNENYQTSYKSGYGSSSAYVCPDDMLNEVSAIYAESQHDVRGGDTNGTWACTLTEYR